ncbi:hypothetical protein [Mesorhizobium sp.]|uniref:hypothetical protein n=1 Tax=Mesorhizobium sp. TaxID=1871066 RepID=UPI000FE4E469|nr:hypothetical protein [Mesorhizobium sp.]RWM29423.1 MAG: hypothetical protein EOR74_07020 [Mesorhizobium sp.]
MNTFPETYRAVTDIVRGGRDLNNFPAIRRKDGREIAVVTLSGYTVGQEPSPVDWARLLTAAPGLLVALKALLPEVDDEIEQRLHGGNAENWQRLKALSDRAHAAVAGAEGHANG